MADTRQNRALAAVLAAAALSACSSSTRPPSASAGASSSTGPSITSSSAHSPYDTAAAKREARRLLTLVRLPSSARRSAQEPHGAGASLASYAVNVPVVPDLVDLHEFFVVPHATPAGLIGWIERHAPQGSIQGDSGGGSIHGEQWTSLDFSHVKGFAIQPEIVANAVSISGGAVALRVDAQTAPRPRLPSNGTGPGEIHIVESGGPQGASRFELRCDPSGGTIFDPARVCSAIAADPALLYSFPGPDHSCPPSPTIRLSGTWVGKPLNSSFSVCTGGQEEQAGRWITLLARGAR